MLECDLERIRRDLEPPWFWPGWIGRRRRRFLERLLVLIRHDAGDDVERLLVEVLR